jgi:hypothetical protein
LEKAVSKVRVPLLALTALALGGPAIGQTAPPASPEPVDAAAALGFHIRDAELRAGLVVEGTPKLSEGPVKRRDPILTVDVRYGVAGVLQQPVLVDDIAIDAGTLLFLAAFRSAAEQTEPLPAWCGASHAGGLGRVGRTVCIVESPDGRARLSEGVVAPLDMASAGRISASLVHLAPSWYVSAVHADGKPSPFPRPAVTPADPARLPLLRLTLVYSAASKNKLYVSSYLQQASGEGGRQYLRTYELPLTDGEARLPFGRFALALQPTNDGVRARWAPQDQGPATATPQEQAPAVAVADLKPTPFVISGVRLDPSLLRPASAPVQLDQVLLSGPASHWHTARADFVANAGWSIHLRTPKGAVFHEVEDFEVDALGARSIKRAWCGPMSALGLPSRTLCVDVRPGGGLGKEVIAVPGHPWMAAKLTGSGPTIAIDHADLQPSEEDLAGPMTFSVVLDDVGRRLSVHAQVEHEGETVTIWRAALPFDADGVARIPFWSHTLVAAKAHEGVKVRWEPNGDGAGPLEAGSHPGG